MAISKEYLKTSSKCKVTFTIEYDFINDYNSAFLVGDFNNWKNDEIPMIKAKDGTFSICTELEPKKTYQFRYLLNDIRWMNDEDADAFIPSPLGDSENSLIIL